MISFLHTLLELGHSTSKNLEFAQSPGVSVSYGEETITETNLLEIRRRHPNKVKLLTFTKSQESKNTGADWEWHIIGRFYTLRLRVQAKRIYKAGGIGNLNQIGKFATTPQIDLLIEDADAHHLFPIYCFYCTEPQRYYWVKGPEEEEFEAFESGCLIANAETVKAKQPKKLGDIERYTVPWHFLCSRNSFSSRRDPYLQRFQEYPSIERYIEQIIERAIPPHDARAADIGLPSIFQLNDGGSNLEGRRGVLRTSEAIAKEFIPAEFERRGVAKLLKVDMRTPDLFAIGG